MTTENNKIIAEFMGYEIQKDPTERFFGRYKQPLGAWTKEIDLSFHHDWSWLMEVVEKIESLNFDFAIYTGSAISIINTKDFPFDEIINLVASSKIQAVYNACVEFIKWYNEQNK